MYQRSRSHELFFVFFCVHIAVATRGQYSALSKFWWFCVFYPFLFVFDKGQIYRSEMEVF